MAATTGCITRSQLEDLVQDGSIDTVILAVTDTYGKLCGKRLDAAFFLESPHTSACNYLFACDMDMTPIPGFAKFNYELGFGDVRLEPAWETLRICTWHEKTALVLCDAVDERDRQLVDVVPRTILLQQLEAAKKQGLHIKAASEMEYYAFRETYAEARRKNYHNLEPLSAHVQDYSLQLSGREEKYHGAFRRHLRDSGVPVESSKGEAGPGQQELNVCYADALVMADRTAVYKQCIKEVADQLGIAVTFMAKPVFGQNGSSCHIHVSLWNADGSSAFYDPAATPWHGLHVTDLFKHFLGGLLRHTSDILPFYAPTINSYKRYKTGQWAPTRLAWCNDNRTTSFRVVGEEEATRIEVRVPGADCNFYLALAALIACGLAGIRDKVDPGPPFEGNVYAAKEIKHIPTSLRTATARLAASAFAREAFGDAVVDHYAHFYENETDAFEAAVTDFELQRYLERI